MVLLKYLINKLLSNFKLINYAIQVQYSFVDDLCLRVIENILNLQVLFDNK